METLKKMKIRIDKRGQVSISVENAVGEDCMVFTKAVEQAVGKIEKRTLTEAYYQDELTVGVPVTAVASD